jgi:transcriptional regulator NrdR family protein
VCPNCGKTEGDCIDSRLTKRGRRRRRVCRNKKCKHRWTTFELDTEFIVEMQEAVQKLARIRNEV